MAEKKQCLLFVVEFNVKMERVLWSEECILIEENIGSKIGN